MCKDKHADLSFRLCHTAPPLALPPVLSHQPSFFLPTFPDKYLGNIQNIRIFADIKHRTNVYSNSTYHESRTPAFARSARMPHRTYPLVQRLPISKFLSFFHRATARQQTDKPKNQRTENLCLALSEPCLQVSQSDTFSKISHSCGKQRKPSLVPSCCCFLF